MRRSDRLFLALLAGLCLSAAVPAAEDQFYFVAKTVTSAGPVPGATHVYLRWDATEGRLPDDVLAFRLLRNGEAVGPDWPRDAVRTPAQIEVLYRGADHLRRKLETITRLNEIASEAGESFNPGQFAQTLHDLIDPANAAGRYNPLWAFVGSRTDFNVARARYRAWIDTDPVPAGGAGLVEYELLGVNGADTVRLGYVEIDPTAQQQVLGAANLRQVRVSDWNCDLPENSQDHYTVMLDWDAAGGANAADRTAAQAYIAGFDLYRTTENLAPTDVTAPARDIAALAAAATVDPRGRPELDGLEKVNVSLIIDAGPSAADPEWLEARQYHVERLGRPDELPPIPDANVPIDPKWVEARDQLMRAGLKPGDRRGYYLVPRDFTGNYGPTTGAVVEVPLMTRPPAPWNLRTFADATGGLEAWTITWDEVDLDNYIDMYRGTRLFCNTVEAAVTGVLEYVPIGGNCATDPRNAVRLDVRDYRIYRFENFDIAGRFKDSDGDGVEDDFETPDLDGNGRYDAFERSAGMQCNPLQQPAGAKNYLVYANGGGSVSLGRPRLLNPNAEPIARMFDTVPAGNKDTVFWYRVVSEANTPVPFGRLSHMSAPQRGLFPDREPPDPPVVTVTKPEPRPSGCAVETTPDVPWGFSEELSEDEKGETFTVSCGGQDFSVTEPQVRSPNTDQCGQIATACAGQQVSIDFPATGNTGGQACQVDVPYDVDNQFCQAGNVRLVPDFVETDVAVTPGELVPGGPKVTVTPPGSGNVCIAVFEDIDGTATRIGSTCDPGGLTFTPRPGLFCGYAIATDENNNISATVQFPCTITPEHPKTPSPPQVLTLDVDDALARFTFRLPAEQVAMATARLRHEPADGPGSAVVEVFPVIDNAPGESIAGSLPVDALAGTRDRFCLSMMALGRDDGTGNAPNSEWGNERCFTRTATGEDLPVYLPWPDVPRAEQGAALDAALDTETLQFIPLLRIELGASADLLQDGSQIGDCWIQAPEPPPAFRQVFYPYRCFNDGLVRFQSFVEPELRFMLYRQQRVGGGPASDWVQVSPMIDYVHFDRQEVDLGLDSGPVTVWTLNDPFIKAVVPDDKDPTVLRVWFVDQYPFQLAGDLALTQRFEWRYQAVYFDAQHRPVRWRMSDWFGGGQ